MSFVTPRASSVGRVELRSVSTAVHRVALVTTSWPRDAGDASGHFVKAHARALVRGGAQVTVLSAGDAPPPSPLGSADAGISVRWLGGGGAFGWPGVAARLREDPRRALRALTFPMRALVAAPSFDRIVAHWIVPCAFPIALVGPRAPEVWAHGGDVRLLCRAPWLARIVIDALLARDASFVFVAEPLRAALEQSLSARQRTRLRDCSRIEAAPIDLPDAASLSDPRLDHGARVSGRYALWVGRLTHDKRPALASRLAERAALPLVVIGDGPVTLAPPALALGRLPRHETLRYIAHASVVLSTSLEEGSPSVVREARALGVPVVAFAAGDLVERARADSAITIADSDDAFVTALRRAFAAG